MNALTTRLLALLRSMPASDESRQQIPSTDELLTLCAGMDAPAHRLFSCGRSYFRRTRSGDLLLATLDAQREEINRHAIAWENDGEDCRMFTDGDKFVIGVHHHGDGRFIELGSGRDFLTALECVKVGGG